MDKEIPWSGGCPEITCSMDKSLMSTENDHTFSFAGNVELLRTALKTCGHLKWRFWDGVPMGHKNKQIFSRLYM